MGTASVGSGSGGTVTGGDGSGGTTDVGSGTVGSGTGAGDGSVVCASGDEVPGELAVFGVLGAPGVCVGLTGDGVGRCVAFGVGRATPAFVSAAGAFRRFGAASAGIVVRSGRWFVIAPGFPRSGTTIVRCPDP